MAVDADVAGIDRDRCGEVVDLGRPDLEVQMGVDAVEPVGVADRPDDLAALRSVQVDVAALEDSDDRKADLIDGAIGEASMFHETFGYYAQGVSRTTAILPDGWESRLIRYETPATNGAVAWCLEPHDLWVSKAVAGRPKDFEFCRTLLDLAIVESSTLRQRLGATEAEEERLDSARAWATAP